MKPFLIRYKFDPTSGSVEEWHRQVAAFISALETDPELRGRIHYCCMKVRDSRDYYHLAEPLDEEVPKLLQQRDWFRRYTEETKRVGGGTVEVLPLEVIAETNLG
jgi:hypothetical protein